MKEIFALFPLFQGLVLNNRAKRVDWKEILIVVVSVCSVVILVQYAFFGRFEDRFSRIEKDITELKDGQKDIEDKIDDLYKILISDRIKQK